LLENQRHVRIYSHTCIIRMHFSLKSGLETRLQAPGWTPTPYPSYSHSVSPLAPHRARHIYPSFQDTLLPCQQLAWKVTSRVSQSKPVSPTSVTHYISLPLSNTATQPRFFSRPWVCTLAAPEKPSSAIRPSSLRCFARGFSSLAKPQWKRQRAKSRGARSEGLPARLSLQLGADRRGPGGVRTCQQPGQAKGVSLSPPGPRSGPSAGRSARLFALARSPAGSLPQGNQLSARKPLSSFFAPPPC